MDQPRAAIFDLDGTLADSALLHAESWRLLSAELGLEHDEALFKRTFGRANKDIIPELVPGADDAHVVWCSDRKEELFRDLARTQLKLYPGAIELLQGLAADGWRLGIGSSTPRSNLDCVLPLLGLDEYIDVSVGMEDVQRHKPEPDTFLEVARRLDVEPARCLVFEDAPAGTEAGERGGMIPIGVTTHHPAERLTGAVATRDGVWSVTVDDCRRWLAGEHG